MTDQLTKLASETSAKLIPHTTSSMNKTLILDALRQAQVMALDEAAGLVSKSPTMTLQAIFDLRDKIMKGE